MSLQSISLRSAFLIGISLLTFFGYVADTAQAASATPIVVLTVTPRSVINGDPVTVEWYIDGPVTNCSITGILGMSAIDLSSLPGSPVNDSVSVVPPPNGETDYILNCDGDTSVAVVFVNPVIILDLPGGSNYTVNSGTGFAPPIALDWETQFANRCSDVWYETASNPGVPIAVDLDSAYGSSRNDYFGTVTFSQASLFPLSETSTVFITCYNDVTGTETTESIVINVDNSNPPGPITITMSSPQSGGVDRSVLYGFATVSVHWSSTNAATCFQSATYDDNSPSPNPWGWSTSPSVTSGDRYNLQIDNTTKFIVTCSRPAVTINGTLYPATSNSFTLRIPVNLPPGVPDLASWDRSGLAPVTASINVIPNPATKDLMSGEAIVSVEATSANADYCELSAWRTNGTPLDYTDDVEFNLINWTKDKDHPYRKGGDGTNTYINIRLSTTTRLSAYCVREYDLLYGDAAEIANGTETVDELAEVKDSTATLPDPVAYIYGNGVIYEMKVMIPYSGSDVTGFSAVGDYSHTDTTGSIEFDFWDPYGDEGDYNIHFSFCDESDGESVFDFYVNGSRVANYTTNRSDVTIPNCLSSNTYSALVKTGVHIKDGQKIRIECEVTGGVGEHCMMKKIFFGIGNGTTLDLEIDPTIKQQRVPLMWLSENAERCNGIQATTVSDGSIKTISTGWAIEGLENNISISTSTQFTIKCLRTSDSKEDNSSMLAQFPAINSLSAGVLVATGECADPITFVYGPAPAGYGPDVLGICVPLVDLKAKDPSISTSGFSQVDINEVDGTYNNVPARIVIENLGPGALPANSAISYVARVIFAPAFSLPPFNLTPVESPIGIFDDALDAPGGADDESNTLTRVLNGIPFGPHTLYSRVNLDGSPNYPEDPAKLANNTASTNFSLPVPEPPMSIAVTGGNNFVRAGEPVELEWSAHTSYPMDCEVSGAGGITDDFDASDVDPTAYTNSMTSGPINSTSEFTLKCTEPITGESFTKSVTVEVVPNYEER